MKRRSIAMTLVVLCLILLSAILALTKENKGGEVGEAATHLITSVGVTPEPTAADAQEAQDIQGAPAETPAETARAVARQEESAGDDYFDDAAFAGNAQIMALELYDYDGLLTNADFFETETITQTSWLDDMEPGVYGKVYLGVGAKELDWRDDAIRSGIEKAIDRLRQDQPGCVIYIMGVPPVSEYRSSTDTTINKDRAAYINEMLRQIAGERGAWYLDVFSALCDENGYIPSEVTVDGVNFTPGQYEPWYELLASNYVAGNGPGSDSRP